MRAHVGILDHFEVSGFSWLGDGAPRDRVVIRADGIELVNLPADRFRGDLKAAGVGDGRCSFKFVFPEAIAIYKSCEVEVCSATTGKVLPAGKKTLTPLLRGASPYCHSLDRQALALAPLRMQRNGDIISVWARAVASPAANLVLQSLAVSGKQGCAVEQFNAVQQPAPDLPEGSPIFYNVSWSFRTDTSAKALYALFQMEDANSGAPTSPLTTAVSTACIPLDVSWFSVPDAENYTRTSGPVNVDQLILGSIAQGYKIDAATKHIFGDRREITILDWGAGFGRAAMAIKRVLNPQANLFGYDVDQFNVDWARIHLLDIPIGHCDFYPPFCLAAGSVDFVYAISVMTHLTESAQEVWLRELKRIIRKGGGCLLTTRGDHLLREQQVRAPAVLQQLAAYGLSDISPDTNLGPKLENRTYYRGTIQLRDQVEKTWSRYFEIIDYLPYGLQQDAVIMLNK
jgi:SAM-dependent methyltransferase